MMVKYREVLELREIQRSLPRANQLPDPLSHKPVPQYLSAVPLALLPLLPESDSGGSRDHSLSPPESPMRRSSPVSPTSPASPDWMVVPPRLPTPPPTTQHGHPAYLSHLLPAQPVPVRPKPKFSFLPLLETPPASTPSSPYPSTTNSRSVSPDVLSDDQSHHPSTPSLTNASIDSSPSRTSSASPDPPSFLQLPPLHHRAFQVDNQYSKPPYGHHKSYFPPFSEHHPDSLNDTMPHPLPFAVRAIRLEASASPSLLPPSPLSLSPTPTSVGSSPKNFETRPLPCTENLVGSSKPMRRRNFMVVNDMEIEIDADDSSVDVPSSPKPSRPRNVILVNGMEIEVDAEDENAEEEPSKSAPPGACSSPTSFEPTLEPAMVSIPLSPSPSPTPSPPPPPSRSLPDLKNSPRVAPEHQRDQSSSITPSPILQSASPIKSPPHSPRILRVARDRDLQLPPSPKSAPYCVLTRRRPGPS